MPAIVYPQLNQDERDMIDAGRDPHTGGQLPAVTEAPSYAQTDVPMSEAPAVALGFALGYAVARPQSADSFGPFCAVVEALAQRFQQRSNSSIPISEWAVLVSLLPPDLVRRVELLYGMQRGQRWARTGERHPKSGKS